MLVAVFAVLFAAEPGQPLEPAETRCDYITGNAGSVQRVTAPELQVLRQTALAGRFQPNLPAGASIQCGRTDIVPAANDWKVLEAGHPLIIVEVGRGEDLRTGVLEIVGGRLHYRMLAGQLTTDEMPRVQARLNTFQAHFQS